MSDGAVGVNAAESPTVSGVVSAPTRHLNASDLSHKLATLPASPRTARRRRASQAQVILKHDLVFQYCLRLLCFSAPPPGQISLVPVSELRVVHRA